MSCDKPVLQNNHHGNTFSEIKYALHCDTEEILNESVKILKRVGFRLKNQESDRLKHTFMVAPRWLVPHGSFHYVLVVKQGGNTQKVVDESVQSVHLGFRTSFKKMNEIHRQICAFTRAVLVKKPDESSLFIQLPCGEVIEVAGVRWKVPMRPVIKALASVFVLSVLWM